MEKACRCPFPPVVYVVGLIVAVNSGLLMVLLRRYGQVVRALSAPPVQRAREPLPVGAPLPAFTVQSTDGSELTQEDFAGTGGVIAFFGAQCEACHAQAPVLAAMAGGAAPGVSAPVLAVVAGEPGTDDELLSVLGGAVPIALEEYHGPLGRSFHVSRFPTFFEVDADGRIGHVAHVIDAVSLGVVPTAA